MKKFLFFMFLAFELAGCAGSGSLQTRLMVNAKPYEICRVAVLPFENWTREDQAGVTAQRIFHGALVNSGRFEVRPEGDVSLFRLRHRLLPGELLESFHYTDLQEKLQVDAVVQGRLTRVGMELDRGPTAVPVIAMQMNIYDVQRGKLVLSTLHHRWGDEYRKALHFGNVTTITGLLDKMSDEIIADWIQKGIGNCQ
jgi:hypothetical protein